MTTPTPNETNGRDNNGRFAVGNPGGPGNPYGKRTAEIRDALMCAVTIDDLQAMTRVLVEKGRKGDVMAIREVLDRLLGKAKVSMTVEEPEPKLTEEEILLRLRALAEQNPDVVEIMASDSLRYNDQAPVRLSRRISALPDLSN